MSGCLIMLCSINVLHAQSKAKLKAVQRYEIDAKRMGVDAGSEDALPRSREFLRIDSSYYVGWFFEGFYKLNHAADYLGYKNAIAPLERALFLLERDYPKELSTRTNDVQLYFPVYNFQVDYTRIGGALRECYANTEQPEKVVALMRRALRWKFQRELYLDAYNYATLANEASTNDGRPQIYTPTDLEAYKSGSNSYLYPNVNWFDAALKPHF